MAHHNKEQVITFKVDARLAELIGRLPNRSQFIRTAILDALGNICPLCQGSGTLTPEQLQHWEAFQAHHGIAQCSNCEATYLQCDLDVVGRR